jgi:GNAT superfamily N-acetyltransferase
VAEREPTPAIELREATEADAQALARINVEAGRVAWGAFVDRTALEGFEPPTERWRERLAAVPPGSGWVATREGEPVGYALVRPCRDGAAEPGEVTGLYVRPEEWGRGIGRALLERALAALSGSGCRVAVLWTEERNRRPRAIYERLGWRADGAVRERVFLGVLIRELRYRLELVESPRTESPRERRDPA